VFSPPSDIVSEYKQVPAVIQASQELHQVTCRCPRTRIKSSL